MLHVLVKPSASKKKKVTCAPVSRHTWTKEEEEELQIYFKQFFHTKKCPGEKDCNEAIALSMKKGGTIWKIKRDNIKKKVNNKISKIMWKVHTS